MNNVSTPKKSRFIPVIQSYAAKRAASILIANLLLTIIISTTFLYYYNNKVIEQRAFSESAIVNIIFSEFRGLYSDLVVSRVKNLIDISPDFENEKHAIPLPATFTKHLSNEISEKIKGFEVSLFSPYPLFRKNQDISNLEFRERAWKNLLVNPAKEYSEIEYRNGQKWLHYAKGDYMTSQVCVECHNSHPNSIKTDWKVGDMRGILSVSLSLSEAEFFSMEQSKDLFNLMAVIFVVSAFVFFLVISGIRLNNQKMSETQSDMSQLNQDLFLKNKTLEDQTAALIAAQKEMEKSNNMLTKQGAEMELGRLATLNILDDLEEEKLAAQQASRLKSEFLATMSHEIRTPMNGILGMAQILEKSQLNAEQHDSVETILNSGNSLLAIINDILDFSKIESGKLSLETLDFDLNTVLLEISTLLQSQLIEKDLELIIRFPLNAPKIVRGDPVRLRQVVLNILGNAIKFTKSGYIYIDIDYLVENGESLYEIRCIDTGIGISNVAQIQLFESFTQADASTTRKYGGTGLGLAISRRLCNIMGGDIEVSSELEQGSIFAIRLPLMPVEGPIHFSSKPLKGIKVLVVDDNRINRALFKEYLQSFKMDVHCASSGEEALKTLTDGETTGAAYQLVITDFFMPSMDSIELCRRIMARDSDSVPFIIMANSDTYQGNIQDFKTVGISGYLTKPIDVPLLYSMLCKAAAYIESGERPGSILTSFDDRIVKNDSELKNISKYEVNILIVDDIEVNQKVAKAMLEPLVSNVSIVENGLQAVEYVKNNPCDLVLMDCQMPIMDGFEATKNIRKYESKKGKKHVTIIALTANAMQADEKKCLNSGMDDFLAKPFNQNALYEKIKHWLGDNVQITQTEKSDFTETPAQDPETENHELLNYAILDTLENLMGAQLAELIDSFIVNSQLKLEAIKTAAEDDNFDALHETAHACKGLSGNIGATKAMSMSYALEQKGKLKDLKDLHKHLDEFQSVLNETNQALQAYKTKVKRAS